MFSGILLKSLNMKLNYEAVRKIYSIYPDAVSEFQTEHWWKTYKKERLILRMNRKIFGQIYRINLRPL